MNKFYLKLGLPILMAVLLSGCSLPFIGKKQQAALQVNSTPKATVFLDGEHLGTTPFYSDTLKDGDYTLKLISEGEGGVSWENKIKLLPGILTVVSRELAETTDLSGGYTLSLESAVDKKKTFLSVVTIPDGAVISLDNEPKGFSPISLDNLSEGEHLLSVSSPGYVEKSLKAKLVKGHKLTANVQLAKLAKEESLDEKEASSAASIDNKETNETNQKTQTTSQSASGSGQKKTSDEIISGQTSSAGLERPYVKILEAAVGIPWLRVHAETTLGSANEVAKVKVGTYFSVAKQETGWYQIEFKTNQFGWISAKYAELTK